MITTKVRVTKNHIPNVRVSLRRGEETLSQDVANYIANRARIYVPILFGYLEASIDINRLRHGSYEVTAQSTDGGADRDYAHYVEYGTSKMAAQPYMRPAFEDGSAIGVHKEGQKLGRRIRRAARGGA